MDKTMKQKFEECGGVRLTKIDKINIAMAVYLTLEAINESAPIGCDGRPAELVTELGDGVVVIQRVLTQILERMGAPVPEDPEIEVKEGHCACGNRLEHEDYN